MSDEDEIEAIEDHRVDEFDRGTRISLMSDGSLRLKVPLMPPSWRCTDGAFDSFEDQLSRALGVAALGLDKELFSIPSPEPTTLARLRDHLIELRKKHELR